MTGLLVLLALATVVYFVVTGTIALASARRAEILTAQEITRSEFAVIRHEAFDLVRRRRLDVYSATFGILWDLTSAMVRAPWDYAAFAAAERAYLIATHDNEGPDSLPQFVREAHRWPREVVPLLVRLAEALRTFQHYYPSQSALHRWVVRNLPTSQRAQERIQHLWKAEEFIRDVVRSASHGRDGAPPPVAMAR